MRRLSFLPLVIGVLFFTGLEGWPAHATTNDWIIFGGARADKQGQYRLVGRGIGGTVWLDENADGIRQSSEPALPGSQLVFSAPQIRRPDGPDYEQYKVTAFYLKTGAEPVRKANNFYYSHIGCASLIIPPREAGRVKLTVDIRVLSINIMYGNVPSPPRNWPLVDGHFFRETVHPSYWGCDAGFAVTNADGIPFWDTWQRLGLENVGYPISNRYVWRGLVTQAFQKVLMQWRPGKGVFFVNVFDELHDAGKDDVLRVRWATPAALEFDPIAWDWDETVKWSLDLLDENEAIKERYFASPDPLLQYGLPTSRVEDMDDHYAIRTQGAVFQQWKEDVPWAKAGEVTIANGGEIAKALDATCESTVTGSKTCTHLFFSEKPLRNQDPIPLIPQHVDLIGIGLP